MLNLKFVLSFVSVLVLFVAVWAEQNSSLDLSAMRNWTIVLPDDAIPSEVYAAEEFQRLFNDITKSKLTIARTPGAGGNIYIGFSKALADSPAAVEKKDLGLEGLKIKITPNALAIAGGRPRGTIYGVYEFFEKYIGVRFLTKDHTYIPADAAQKKIPCEEHCFKPRLEYRCSSYGETRANPAFAVMLRCNNVARDERFGGVTNMERSSHSFFRQIPSSKYGKEHPEYYCLIAGKRKADVKGQDAKPLVGNQPCLSNPEVLEIVTTSVMEEIEKNPTTGRVSVSQNDNFNYCRCPKCAALDKQAGSHAGSLITFVNAVADEVAKKYPNTKVGTLIYQYTRKPIKGITLRPNVQIQLCSIECSQVFPIDDPSVKANKSFCKDLIGWGKLCNDVRIWAYNTNFHNYLLPCPNLQSIEPNIRLFVNNNAKGIYMQAAGNAQGAEFSDLRNYVTSRLLWNPDLNGQQLIDEFLDLHYGKAAPPIREFINLVHDNAVKKRVTKDCFATAADYGIDGSITQSGLTLFNRAMELADNDEIRSRVEKASICAYRAAVEDAWEWIWWTPLESPRPHLQPMPNSIIKKTRPYASKLFELCDKYHVTHWDELTPINQAKGLFHSAYRLKKKEKI